MERRRFLLVSMAGALAAPLAARAQQKAMPVIGVLHTVISLLAAPLGVEAHAQNGQ